MQSAYFSGSLVPLTSVTGIIGISPQTVIWNGRQQAVPDSRPCGGWEGFRI